MKKILLASFIVLLFTNSVIPDPNSKSNSIMSKSSVSYMYEQGIDQLPHVVFWRKIMNLHQDSCIINIHAERKILTTMHYPTWYAYQGEQKAKILDSFRRMHNLIDSPRIVGTPGKSFFYLFEKVAPKVPLGMQEFEKNNVDPWYAKAILLIESPNQLQKSPAGAYGAFQLMPYVARQYGLKVNKSIDERANFERSAYAASQLIKTICIPYAKQMLTDFGVQEIDEDELWFKLFVMHVYNAGAGNVRTALFTISEPLSGMPLIYKLWNTNAGRFQSSSQNYSQLILAAFVEYDQRIESKS
ncbi:MAG: transglycosylase SLT domain-containing protein [Bacteroidota bacterium]|nr:transglycosylase SLT domain-containing protein [Bacteroidota bacterium]